MNLERVENRVWKQILGAPAFSPVVALYGENGASTVEERDRKIKLGFVQYMLRTSHGLLSAIFGSMRGEIGPGGWMRQLREYMGETGLSFDTLGNITKLG